MCKCVRQNITKYGHTAKSHTFLVYMKTLQGDFTGVDNVQPLNVVLHLPLPLHSFYNTSVVRINPEA